LDEPVWYGLAAIREGDHTVLYSMEYSSGAICRCVVDYANKEARWYTIGKTPSVAISNTIVDENSEDDIGGDVVSGGGLGTGIEEGNVLKNEKHGSLEEKADATTFDTAYGGGYWCGLAAIRELGPPLLVASPLLIVNLI
jgi:hypothetical protein